jgi:hypothetical protein
MLKTISDSESENPTIATASTITKSSVLSYKTFDDISEEESVRACILFFYFLSVSLLSFPFVSLILVFTFCYSSSFNTSSFSLKYVIYFESSSEINEIHLTLYSPNNLNQEMKISKINDGEHKTEKIKNLIPIDLKDIDTNIILSNKTLRASCLSP